VAAYGEHVYAVLDGLSYRGLSGTWTALGIAEGCVGALQATADKVYVLDTCTGSILTALHGSSPLTTVPVLNPMAHFAVNRTAIYFHTFGEVHSWSLDGTGQSTIPWSGTELLFLAASDSALVVSDYFDGNQRTQIFPSDSRPVSTILQPSPVDWSPVAVGSFAFLGAHEGGLHRVAIGGSTPELVYPLYYDAVVARQDRPYWLTEGRILTPTSTSTCDPPTNTAVWSFDYGPTDARILHAVTHPRGGVVVAGVGFGPRASVAHLGGDGAVLWEGGLETQFGMCEFDRPCDCLAVDASGGVLVGGSIGITRLSPNGTIAWTFPLYLATCSLDTSGRAYVVETTSPGITVRAFDAAGGTPTSAAPQELSALHASSASASPVPTGGGFVLSAKEANNPSATVVARLNADLSVAWTKRLSGVEARVRAAPSGFVVAGTAEAAITVDGQTFAVDDGPRSFAIWLSSDGSLETVRILGATRPFDFAVTASGNVAIATESCPLCSARRGTSFARYTVDQYSRAGALVARGEIPGFAALATEGSGVIAAGGREIVVGDPLVDGYIGLEAFATRF
jgi:hypothetical protein